MTKEQMFQIMTNIRTAYLHSFSGIKTDEEFKLVCKNWYRFFEKDDYTIVARAVDKYIANDNTGFAPTIGQIRNAMFSVSDINQLDVGNSWDKVLRNCSCNPQIAKENYEKLEANIQKALGSYRFLVELGYSDNNQVSFARKDFEKKMNEVLAEEKENLISGLIDLNQVTLNNTLPRPKENFIGLNGINLIGNRMED